MKVRHLFILIALPTLSFGQMKQGTFVAGPKIGVNLTKISIVDNPTDIVSKSRFAFNAGVFGRLNYGKFSLQPEVMYQEKGGNFTTPTQQQKYRFVSVPIMFGYRPVKGINLEVGPEYSFALNSGFKESDRNIYGPDNKKDFALIVGTRIDMLDALSMFSINLRYVHGFNDMTDRLFNGTPLNFQNRTIQLSVSYNASEYYKWWRKDNPSKKRRK